jgi:hypothetical protein
LRTFALELKEQLAQTLAAVVNAILAGPRGRRNAENAAEPPLRQIIDVLQQVMCTHDAEKLARPLQRMSRFLPAKAMLYRFSQCKAKRVEQSKERVDSLRIFFCHASTSKRP